MDLTPFLFARGFGDGAHRSPGGEACFRREHLKGWIVGAYYSSEIGMRELGWIGNGFFPAFPGCDHAAGHP